MYVAVLALDGEAPVVVVVLQLGVVLGARLQLRRVHAVHRQLGPQPDLCCEEEK